MFGIIEEDDIYKIQNTCYTLPVYWLFCEDISKLISGSDNPENIKIIKELRKYISDTEKSDLLNSLNYINQSMKGKMLSVNNFNDFFKGHIRNGQEDVAGLILNKNEQSYLMMRTSDFGINISFFKNNLTIENTDFKDIEKIIEGVDIFKTICDDKLHAQVKLENLILENSIPIQTNHIESKLTKF